MPRCQSHKRHVKLDRLCEMCNEYFSTHYRSKTIIDSIVARFLAFKEAKGWGKKALDPHMVPREAYISVDDLARLYEMYGYRAQPSAGYRSKSPMRFQSAAVAAAAASPQTALPTQLRAPPPIHRSQIHEKRIKAYDTPARLAIVSSSSFELAAQGALPDDYYISGGRSPGTRPYSPPVVTEYGTDDPIELDDLVESDVDFESYVSDRSYDFEQAGEQATPRDDFDPVLPELRHLAADQYRGLPGAHSSPSSFLQHPKPRINVRVRAEPGRRKPDPKPDPNRREAASAITLVKKFTAIAATLRIEGYPNPESPMYPDVPRMSAAPRTPSWRRKSESLFAPVPRGTEEKEKADEAHVVQHSSAAAKPEGKQPATGTTSRTPSLALAPAPQPQPHPHPRPQRAQHLPLRTAPSAYYVVAEPDPASASGGSVARVHSPSQSHVVVPPPQRLEGVLVHHHPQRPCQQGGRERDPLFFRELGLPPDADARVRVRGCLSAPPVLVSVRAPAPNFSCAVQALCFCGGGGGGNSGSGERCPSCAERERLGDELQMDWI